jgi:hypothetical protein
MDQPSPFTEHQMSRGYGDVSTKGHAMDRKGAWVIAGAIVIGFVLHGLLQLVGHMTQGQPGRYQLRDFGREGEMVFDTASGRISIPTVATPERRRFREETKKVEEKKDFFDEKKDAIRDEKKFADDKKDGFKKE